MQTIKGRKEQWAGVYTKDFRREDAEIQFGNSLYSVTGFPEIEIDHGRNVFVSQNVKRKNGETYSRRVKHYSPTWRKVVALAKHIPARPFKTHARWEDLEPINI